MEETYAEMGLDFDSSDLAVELKVSLGVIVHARKPCSCRRLELTLVGPGDG